MNEVFESVRALERIHKDSKYERKSELVVDCGFNVWKF